MATALGIVLVKKFNYRGDPNEEFSNRYWFTGTPPSTDAAWETAVTQLATSERACYSAQTTVVRAYGYDDNSPNANAVYVKDFAVPGPPPVGSLPQGTGVRMAGDQAGFCWWQTDRKTSPGGKWIYLRKYFHDGFVDPVDTDALSQETTVEYANFAQLLAGGTFALGKIRSQNQEEQLQNWGRDPWVTTRTLKRRGKRPTQTP